MFGSESLLRGGLSFCGLTETHPAGIMVDRTRVRRHFHLINPGLAVSTRLTEGALARTLISIRRYSFEQHHSAIQLGRIAVSVSGAGYDRIVDANPEQHFQ